MSALKAQDGAPLYQQLADTLESMIQTRSLRPGDRMPSVRHFSQQRRISVPTALHAYATLEMRGLIEARPKSGFYVRARRSDGVELPRLRAQTPTVTDFAQLEPLEAIFAAQADPKLIPLGAALPDPKVLPGVKLAREIGAIGRRLGVYCTDYDLPPGNEGLRRELARLSLDWGCDLQPDEFIITNGCTEALSLALRAVCSPGDTVVVESPTYFGLAAILRELELQALPIPVDSEHGMDLDVLEKALRKKRVAACALIPNYHNPVGFCMPDAAKQRLCEILRARSIPLIEDDIYGDLQHSGPRPRCIRAFDTDENVILCGSFSKTLAPGFRIGYIAAARWQKKVLDLKRNSSFCNATLPTLAVAEFLRNGGYERYLRKIRGFYGQQVAHMREIVVRTFPKGIALSRPKGGFVLWCELPATVDGIELSRRAQAAGISIAPGPLFSPDGGDFGNFIRLNCGYELTGEIEAAVATVGRLAKNLANR